MAHTPHILCMVTFSMLGVVHQLVSQIDTHWTTVTTIYRLDRYTLDNSNYNIQVR